MTKNQKRISVNRDSYHVLINGHKMTVPPALAKCHRWLRSYQYDVLVEWNSRSCLATVYEDEGGNLMLRLKIDASAAAFPPLTAKGD